MWLGNFSVNNRLIIFWIYLYLKVGSFWWIDSVWFQDRAHRLQLQIFGYAVSTHTHTVITMLKQNNIQKLWPTPFTVVCVCVCVCIPVNLLSMELTYFCSGLLFAAVVRRWVWDYALTVTLLHILLTSLGKTHSNIHDIHTHSWHTNIHTFMACTYIHTHILSNSNAVS